MNHVGYFSPILHNRNLLIILNDGNKRTTVVEMLHTIAATERISGD